MVGLMNGWMHGWLNGRMDVMKNCRTDHPVQNSHTNKMHIVCFLYLPECLFSTSLTIIQLLYYSTTPYNSYSHHNFYKDVFVVVVVGKA